MDVNDVVTDEDVTFVFYSTHRTSITKWHIEESRIEYEVEIQVPNNGMLHLHFQFAITQTFLHWIAGNSHASA